MWRFLFRTEIDEVFATSRSEPADDETAAVTARLANGALAACAFSQRAGTCNEVDIYGQTARLQFSCQRFDSFSISPLESRSGGMRSRLRRVSQLMKESPQAASVLRHGGDSDASYAAEWRHFVDAVRRQTPVESTIEDGRRALQVVLAAVESASLGRPVSVATAPRAVRRQG